MNDIGDRIKKTRQEQDLSLKDIEKFSGISASTIQRYETGVSRIPINNLEYIAKALKVSPGYLMGWESRDIPSAEYEPIKPLLECLGWEIIYDCEDEQFALYNANNKCSSYINYKQLKGLMDKSLSYIGFELQNIIKTNTKDKD